jgi:hypothetical protein
MIGLALPSRKRPDRLRFALETAFNSACAPENVHVVVALDEDDPELDAYQRELSHYSHNASALIGTFGTSVAGWNAAAQALFERGANAIHMAADDLQYFNGWDIYVRALVETKGAYWIAHYKDDYRDELRACNPFVS